MRILAVNAGSSTLKLAAVADDGESESRTLAAAGGALDEAALADALASLGAVDASGHRIVHGGRRFSGPVRIDDDVVAELRELADLAPLHQPKSLAALDAVRRALPDTPAVACFDTAFHATMDEAAATYALPLEWRERFGARRYGFHGLSHAYAANRAAKLLGRPVEDLLTVVCHLGAGASVTAVDGGRSVDTTMGFTPLEGLVMATRSGSVDPGLLLWLLERVDVSPEAMAHALEHESGLVALAGTADMREVLERARANEARSTLALAVYLHRLRAAIAAMAAALGGLDALVFTGGVGERAPAIRAGAAGALAFLGVEIDPDENEGGVGDRDIAATGAKVRTLVIESREDLELARQVRETLSF
jgi:acetate kinase